MLAGMLSSSQVALFQLSLFLVEPQNTLVFDC